MQNKKISVITPVYNCECFIETCIQSVLKQTYKNIEHIIIDGNSTDDTTGIITKYALNNPTVKWISEPDNGIYDAMNKGIEIASGDYYIFLGADDVFYNNTVLEEISLRNGIFDFDFIYGKVLFKTKNLIYGRSVDLNDLKKENIAHQAILYKNELFHKIGKYGTTFKVSEDYVFNIKCFQDETVKKIFIDKIFVLFNDTATSSYLRDGFLKYRLTFFKNLTFKEKFLKLYFYFRPDWFVPTKFFRK
jgi:glycosyltransferase involved in cell wall biosynthesis